MATRRGLLIVYVFVFAFPVVSVCAVCWGLYYGLGHHDGPDVLTISESVQWYPQSRVFALTTQVVAWGGALVFIIRNCLYGRLVRESAGEGEDCCARFSRWAMYVLTVVTVVGMAGVSVLSLLNSGPLHGLTALMFFVGGAVYCLISDIAMRRVRQVPVWPMALTSLAVCAGLLYLVFSAVSVYRSWGVTVASLCQYAFTLLLFCRFGCFALDGRDLQLEVALAEARVGEG